MKVSVPPVEYIVTPSSFNFFTIGSRPSLLYTEINAELIDLDVPIVLCCVCFVVFFKSDSKIQFILKFLIKK